MLKIKKETKELGETFEEVVKEKSKSNNGNKPVDE